MKHELKTFIRISEFESESSLLDFAQGVWLDGFYENITDEAIIADFIKRDKYVCIVSPELHGRPYDLVWNKYKNFSKDVLGSGKLILCTDYPEEAMEYFYEE